MMTMITLVTMMTMMTTLVLMTVYVVKIWGDENEELCSKLKEEYCDTPEELVTNSVICVYLGFEDDALSGVDMAKE